jgi:hypothetical protein
MTTQVSNPHVHEIEINILEYKKILKELSFDEESILLNVYNLQKMPEEKRITFLAETNTFYKIIP